MEAGNAAGSKYMTERLRVRCLEAPTCKPHSGIRAIRKIIDGSIISFTCSVWGLQAYKSQAWSKSWPVLLVLSSLGLVSVGFLGFFLNRNFSDAPTSRKRQLPQKILTFSSSLSSLGQALCHRLVDAEHPWPGKIFGKVEHVAVGKRSRRQNILFFCLLGIL